MRNKKALTERQSKRRGKIVMSMIRPDFQQKVKLNRGDTLEDYIWLMKGILKCTLAMGLTYGLFVLYLTGG